MNNSGNKVSLWVVAGVLVFGSIIALAAFSHKPGQPMAGLADIGAVSGWTYGPENSSVELTEYADFQCPACGLYYGWFKKLKAEFGDRVKFSFKHLPLIEIHKNALPAAEAAEAAGAQGKFWEMHDLIFENQGEWSESDDATAIFASYADKLLLDPGKFHSDFSSDATAQKIMASRQAALTAGLNHTPTFFLNKQEISNPANYEAFRNVLLQALR